MPPIPVKRALYKLGRDIRDARRRRRIPMGLMALYILLEKPKLEEESKW